MVDWYDNHTLGCERDWGDRQPPPLRIWYTEFVSPVDGERYGRNVIAESWEAAQSCCDAGGIGEKVIGETVSFGLVTPDGTLTVWEAPT